MTKTLRVKAVEAAMVVDYEAMEGGVLRFLGRRHEPYVPPANVKLPRNETLRHGDAGAWPMTGEVVTVPFRREYLDELRAGCLVPADEETAKACGVPFTTAN